MSFVMPAKNRSRAIVRQIAAQAPSLSVNEVVGKLLTDIRALVDSARGQVAQAVNAGLVRLYWSAGRRIRQDILKEQRGEYGEKIVQTLSAQLE